LAPSTSLAIQSLSSVSHKAVETSFEQWSASWRISFNSSKYKSAFFRMDPINFACASFYIALPSAPSVTYNRNLVVSTSNSLHHVYPIFKVICSIVSTLWGSFWKALVGPSSWGIPLLRRRVCKKSLYLFHLIPFLLLKCFFPRLMSHSTHFYLSVFSTAHNLTPKSRKDKTLLKIFLLLTVLSMVFSLFDLTSSRKALQKQ